MERKYKQRGYQNEEREQRPQHATNHQQKGDIRAPKMPAFREVTRCSLCGTPGDLPEGGHFCRANIAFLLMICSMLRPLFSFFVLIAALLILSFHENLLWLGTGK